MISCQLKHLEARCRERGYTLDEVRACIVSEDGDTITVHVDHPAYPREAKPGFVPPQPAEKKPNAPTHGPGTELKKLLKRVGITATPNCSCNARARTMDTNGCDWCEAHLDEIVGWLREEATKRGLPFVDMAGRVLVKRAISNARKAEARRAKEAQPAESGPA
jgi:hypothetical protein